MPSLQPLTDKSFSKNPALLPLDDKTLSDTIKSPLDSNKDPIGQEKTPDALKKEKALAKAKSKGLILVDKQRTPLSATDVFVTVQNAVKTVLGVTTNVDSVAKILIGQIMAETSLRSCYNFNVGNIKAYGSAGQFWKGKTYALDAGEIINKKSVVIENDLFRAYDSLGDGINDWVFQLKSKWGDAVESAKKGDIEGFVLNLKRKGYFTADVNQYMKNVKGGIAAFQNKLDKENKLA